MKSSTTIVATAALLAASVSAQQQYTIDPSSVPNTTKDAWCSSQTTQCPLICLQTSSNDTTPISNSCDSTDLTFACVCGNGLSPNVSEYTLTLPYYICEEWGSQCVSNCGSDNNCSNDCRSQHPCGAQHPKAGNTSTSSATMSATAAATTTGSGGDTLYTGFAGSASSSTGKSSAAHIRVAALNAGKTFGTLGVVGLLFGGFAVLL